MNIGGVYTSVAMLITQVLNFTKYRSRIGGGGSETGEPQLNEKSLNEFLASKDITHTLTKLYPSTVLTECSHSALSFDEIISVYRSALAA